MSGFRLNRFFSGPLTRLLLKTPLTPNQITFISLGLGILSGILFSKGTYACSVAAAAGYQLAIVLDNCDGEVARAKNKRSAIGGWLDIMADIVTDISLFLGIGIAMIRQNTEDPIQLFLVLCLSGCLMHCFLVVLEKLKGFGPAVFDTPHPEHENRKNVFLDIFDAIREGDASWFVVFFALIDRMSVLVWAGGVYMQLLWISATFVNFRWLFRSKNIGSIK